MKETDSTETTPEQLLRILDLQLAAQRSQRGSSARNRVLLLVSGVLFIIIGAGVALMILGQMLEDIPRAERPEPASSDEVRGNY